MIGRSIAHYTITEEIGRGGMGEVYLATGTKLKRKVAVKVLSKALGGDEQHMARLTREAEVLASLDHPGIGQIYGIEEVIRSGLSLSGNCVLRPLEVRLRSMHVTTRSEVDVRF